MVSGPGPDRLAFLRNQMAGTAVISETVSKAEHLLKVAGSVARDAHAVWAEMWGEFKPHVTPGGLIGEQIAKGFVPACGWDEFLEKFWLLRHYLDSIDRLSKSRT